MYAMEGELHSFLLAVRDRTFAAEMCGRLGFGYSAAVMYVESVGMHMKLVAEPVVGSVVEAGGVAGAAVVVVVAAAAAGADVDRKSPSPKREGVEVADNGNRSQPPEPRPRTAARIVGAVAGNDYYAVVYIARIATLAAADAAGDIVDVNVGSSYDRERWLSVVVVVVAARAVVTPTDDCTE